MVGLDIHTPSGRVVHVPLRQQQYSFTTLFGRTPQGWLVSRGCAAFLVADGRATRLPKVDLCSLGYGYGNTLSEDRRHLLWYWTERDLGIRFASIDLTDPHARSLLIEDAYDIRGGTGDTGYVAKYDGLYDVELATGEVSRRMGRQASAIDIAHDTAFVANRKTETYGPTSLSAPGKVTWRQPFWPTDMSPGGTYVLGHSYDYTSLQVRRMSDGHLVRRIPFPDDFSSSVFSDIGWDTDHSVVMVKVYGERRALVRCEVPTGRCRRVTRVTRLAVSLPTTIAGPHEGQ